ncbi:CsxC family protein [Aneurinibacillus sp. REN35]|uniref:CsxC family protein n=1 Tax=Aneurinibacillus sp. REN35 TaxID=3237286 RepID=UPI003526FE33
MSYQDNNYDNSSQEMEDPCRHKIISVETISECPSSEWPATGVPGPLVVKTPVVLTEARVQVNIEAIVRLPRAAISIRKIEKDVHIKQCKILPFNDAHTIKAFIRGFVRKTIEFADIKCVDDDGISGGLDHLTTDIPFECATEIKTSVPIQGLTFYDPQPQGDIHFSSKHGMHTHSKESAFLNRQHFAEKPFCELIYAQVIELDTVEEKKGRFCGEHYAFDTIKEIMVVDLYVKILQRQQVDVPGKPAKKKGPFCIPDIRSSTYAARPIFHPVPRPKKTH